MATINGVTFNMQSLRPVAVHRNSVSEQPGSDTNFITDMGYDGLVLRLEGFEETLATYDSVISEFMKSGEQTLVHRTGWQFEVYSAQLTPELIRGFADNYFPYDLILYTSTPYRESTTLSCRAKAITTNNQEWSAEDMLCNNLFDYWSFEDWSAGTSSAPDGWVKGGTGATIAREGAEVKIGTYSAKLTYGSAICYIQPYVTNYLDYSGKTMTVGIWAKTSTASLSRLRVIDGTTTVYSTFHTGGGDWEFLTATINVSSTPSYLAIYARADVAGFVYYDGAVLVEGDSIPDTTFTRDIDTDGSVDAVPDIQVTGGAVVSTAVRNSGLRWDDEDATTYDEWNTTYTLEKTFTYTADPNRAYTLDTVGLDVRSAGSSSTGYGKVTYEIAGGGEVQAGEWSQYGLTWSEDNTATPDVSTAVNEALVVRFYQKHSSGGTYSQIRNLVSTVTTLRKNVCKSPQVYNTADTTVKSNVANEIEPDMKFRINIDGTGIIVYTDDINTNKYLDAYWDKYGVTYDDGNNELDFGNSEYLTYKIDTKYPITGTPTLTSIIDIDTGTPTIKISSDNVTYYDIDTAIVDNVSTVYDLDNAPNLSLKGRTTFYLKFNCDGSSTCSLTTFSLSINIVTIDVEHPTISSDGVSTFRCDQHADSGLNCTVALIYRDRSWPA